VEVRFLIIKVVMLNRWFTGLTTSIIILNSVNLSIYDYSDRDSLTSYNNVLNILNKIFTFMFLGESIIKILAMGFIMHENSYLRDGWNILDFFIVIIG
jgi:Mg2+/Co2+ transporter CorB